MIKSTSNKNTTPKRGDVKMREVVLNLTLVILLGICAKCPTTHPHFDMPPNIRRNFTRFQTTYHMPKLSLDQYLKLDKNSVFKEKLVNYRFFYEVKLASARIQNDIRIYIPEIDKDGYDIVLDDGDTIMPFQLIATNNSSKTSKWEVQKNLLRPNPLNCTLLGYEQSSEGDGTGGGFILVSISVNTDTIQSFDYYYTDAYILKAFELGILRYNRNSYEKKIELLIGQLQRGNRREKVVLTKSNLVKVKSVDHLLALADIPSICHNQWQPSFRAYLQNTDSIIENERKDLVVLLKELIDDKNVAIS